MPYLHREVYRTKLLQVVEKTAFLLLFFNFLIMIKEVISQPEENLDFIRPNYYSRLHRSYIYRRF